MGALAKGFVLATWAAVVAGTLFKLEVYEGRPGSPMAPVIAWPKGSALLPDPLRPTLLCFLHPQCPCSRATLDELDRLLTAQQGQATAYAVFIEPAGAPSGWLHTDLVRHAGRIPGVRVVRDYLGAECRLFGARISGDIALYSPGGKAEVFCGGITPSRGHEGESTGAREINSYLSTGRVTSHSSPAYGCSLF